MRITYHKFHFYLVRKHERWTLNVYSIVVGSQPFSEVVVLSGWILNPFPNFLIN